jgi:hypothetical protein
MTITYEPGRYLARVIYQYFGESQQGTVKFCLRIQILQNLDRPDAMPRKAPEREINWWITPKTLNRVTRELAALGYTGKTLSGLDPDTEGFYDFAGREFEVTCEYEEGQDGRTWERWTPRPTHKNLKSKAGLRRLDRILGNPTTETAIDDPPENSDEDEPF